MITFMEKAAIRERWHRLPREERLSIRARCSAFVNLEIEARRIRNEEDVHRYMYDFIVDELNVREGVPQLHMPRGQ